MSEFINRMDRIRAKVNEDRFDFPGVYENYFPVRAFKKIECGKTEAIAILRIPSHSTIVKPYSIHQKYRTNEAYVTRIEDLEGNELDPDMICRSGHDSNFMYKKVIQLNQMNLLMKKFIMIVDQEFISF